MDDRIEQLLDAQEFLGRIEMALKRLAKIRHLLSGKYREDYVARLNDAGWNCRLAQRVLAVCDEVYEVKAGDLLPEGGK